MKSLERSRRSLAIRIVAVGALFCLAGGVFLSCIANTAKDQVRRDAIMVQDLGHQNVVYDQIFAKTVWVCGENTESLTLHGGSVSLKTTAGGPSGASYGRGVIVGDPNTILTAAHCVDHCIGTAKIFVLTHGHYTSVEWVPVYFDRTNDYCVLRIKSAESLPAFTIAALPKVGQRIVSYGVGWKGSDVQTVEKTAFGLRIRHSAYLEHGDSGGPICDYDGKLIGINQSFEGFTHIGIAVMPKELLKAE